jgi:hypothetical protein
MDGWGWIPGMEKGLLCAPWYPDCLWGEPSLLPNGYWGGGGGGKRLVPEADHSAPFNTKVKNDEAIPPLSLMSSWHIV